MNNKRNSKNIGISILWANELVELAQMSTKL